MQVESEAGPPVQYSLNASPHASHSEILEHFPAPGRDLRVLDLGCANGYLAALIAERGYRVTGVERPGGVTGEFPPSVRLIHADLDFGLPDLDSYYDRVVCADVLEHLRNPERLLEQTREILAPGGALIASLPNSGNLYFRLKILFGDFPRHDKGLFDRTHVRFFVWDGWVELFHQAGWRIDSVRPTCVPVHLAFPGSRFRGPIRMAETVSYWMARFWKRLFAYQFVVVASPVSEGS